jgi:hypothetical protein
MHDCRPHTSTAALPDEAEARRQPDFGGTWNGDVFRTVIQLRSELTTHRVLVLDDDQGLGVVYPGEPDEVLDWTPDRIRALDFDAFQNDQAQLLNLKPPSHFDLVLEDVAQLRGA